MEKSEYFSIWTTAFVALVLGFTQGCHSARKQLASAVNVADPATTIQLIAGFHGLEGNSWRWTARKFAVTLQPPIGAEEVGAKLRLNLYIPDEQIKKLGPMTLTAEVNYHSLDPQTFSKSGAYEYTRDVPPDALRSNIIPVVFAVDKASPPSAAEARELGVVVTSVSLQSK